jgi:ribosomal peptide maturation radical SAM protein 1
MVLSSLKVKRGVDALLIVPPFASLDKPALGAHILQACAREAGFTVATFYANLLFAAEIGEANYHAVCFNSSRELIGERLFAAAAYAVPPLGRSAIDRTVLPIRSSVRGGVQLDLPDLQVLERRAATWLDELTAAILRLDCKLVGCSTTFQQTAASVALLKRIKHARPEIVTIIGGANCEGEMAQGIVSLDAGIDFVFSGESERSFTLFLKDVHSGCLPAQRIIGGEPCANLDLIPTVDFSDYYQQLYDALPDSRVVLENDIWLPYESSRGCWWGQRHHCTFCGLNGQTMAFRAKSADRVLSDLKQLLKSHPSKHVGMIDNIMPHEYFKSLIPRLGEELPGVHMFYEQKANLSLADVVALKRAGVGLIQAGIEALSSSLLKRMDKGVSARQNVALLRYARSVGLPVNWNLLYGFPGDRLSEYEQTLALLPLLAHLHPPLGTCPLSIDRFSPYFNRPDAYGLTRVRPLETYRALLPESADVAKLAYHFVADYASESLASPKLMSRIADQVERWRDAWVAGGATPALDVTALSNEQFLLLDTRGLPGTREVHFLTRAQAALLLAGARGGSTSNLAWALEHRLVAELESMVVPLATADPALIAEFETEARELGSRDRVSAPNPGRTLTYEAQ